MVSEFFVYIFQLALGVGDYNICTCEGSMGIEFMTARWKNPIPLELVLSISKRERSMKVFSIVFTLYVMHTFQEQHMIPSEWCHRSFNTDSLVSELLPKISSSRCILTKQFVINRQQLHNT